MATPVVFASIVLSVVCGGGYIAMKQRFKHIPTESRRLRLFDDTGRGYDGLMRRYEWARGVSKRRKMLMPLATGHVLEIASGTGRNFQFFNKARLSSITCVDLSRTMLREAKKKEDLLAGIPTRFFHANAMKLPFPDECFDTLVCTCGLCCFERPIETFNEALRTLKVGGFVLLLEHGISSWPVIPLFQDGLIERHAYIWGCFNTRNIVSIIAEFEELEILETDSWRYGTYHAFVARKTRPSPVRPELKHSPAPLILSEAPEDHPVDILKPPNVMVPQSRLEKISKE